MGLETLLGWIGKSIVKSLIGAGFNSFFANAVLKIGVSLLINAATNAIFGSKSAAGPKAQDVARELSLPTTAPVYRYVYGETRATGTPVGTPIRGPMIWGCWLLNSRPSDLSVPKLFLDKREILWSGDPFDFTSGGGAVATAAPFVGYLRFWISRGDKTSPPAAVLAAAPWAAGADEELWKPTDRWSGRTVIWINFDAGDAGQRQERWPNSPPLVEVEGRWSRVWNPRILAQDPADPATWTWSDNHALCCLDVLRQNPVQQYQVANLHLPSWQESADVADELVALKSGGSQKRYRVAGTLTFGEGEIEDLINPMVLSGAGNLIRIGGQLGLAPGCWQVPITTIASLAGSQLEESSMISGDQLVNEIRVSYLSPTRGYETAELRPWPIPGALAADGGIPKPRNLSLTFCADAYQAQRVRKITGLRLRRQQGLSATFWPEEYDLIGGSTLTLALPNPWNAFDGTYEVETINPAFDTLGEQGLAMLLPVTITRHGADVYGWSPDIDEETVVDEPYNATRTGVQMPGPITVTTGPGVDLNTGGTVIPRIRFAFLPSLTTDTLAYTWEYREAGGDWTAGGSIDGKVRDTFGFVFGFLLVSVGVLYDIRVRTVATIGQSDAREITGVSSAFAVSGGSATRGLGSVRFQGTAPIVASMDGLIAYRTASPVFDDLTPVTAQIAVLSGAVYDFTAGDATRTNLLANGDFSGGAASWSLGAGWAVAAGKATHSGAVAGNLDQTLTIASGAIVRTGLTVTGRTTASAVIRLVGTTTNDSANLVANQQEAATITAPAAMTAFRVLAGANYDGSVDDIAAYVQTGTCLPQGRGYYWLRPVSLTGLFGTPDGPYDLTVI